MNIHSTIFLILVCIGIILMAGCTGTSKAPDMTSTTQQIDKTVIVTPAQTTMPIVSVTTAVPVKVNATSTLSVSEPSTSTMVITPTTQSSSDPILHRWIRQYRDQKTGLQYAYEFRFYPGGILNYQEGNTKMVSSNIIIEKVIYMASGTWTSMGNNKYLVNYLPVGVSGAQLVREYTLVPAHEKQGYPGVIIPSHIESNFETNNIKLGSPNNIENMYYPEQAKID